MLTWASFVSMAWGHPFESQFVGHKNTLEIHPTHLELEFSLEVPLPLVERAYRESGPVNKKIWLDEWMREQQKDIEQNIWLEIDGVRHSTWTKTMHEPPMWKEESNFLVFTSTLEYQSSKDIQSILLLDQVFIGEPSVYWLDAQISRGLVVLATDTIEVDGDRYTTHLKRWEMEESRREVRLSMYHSIWTRLDAWWNATILHQEPLQTIKEAFLPQDVWKAWTLGKTPLWIGMLSLFLGVVSGIKGYLRSTVMVCLMALVVSIVPVLPVHLRLSLIVVSACGVLHNRWWPTVLGCMMVLICQPSWILIAPLMLGLAFKLIFRT